jgi:2-methylisocitrate lyase-like PEP mutase family enzyme
VKQADKADSFRRQHHENKILILPNVWDTITARLISSSGFNSLATASFSVAAANGYEDGEKIPFDKVVKVVTEISDAVDVPVSVDFERGYANDLASLADNVRQLLEAGAIGINIEDRASDGKGLVSVDAQCKKLETIREAGIKFGVNIFINARTDAYLLKANNFMNDTIERGKAYQNAGADCFYPVLIDNYSDMEHVLSQITIPMNVLLMKQIGDLKKLEEIGVKRVSLGPGSLRYLLTKLRNMAVKLTAYDTSEFFSEELIPNAEVMALLKKQS